MQLIFLCPDIVPLPKHHQAPQTGYAEECSLSSNSLSKINQSWTHLSWTQGGIPPPPKVCGNTGPLLAEGQGAGTSPAKPATKEGSGNLTEG